MIGIYVYYIYFLFGSPAARPGKTDCTHRIRGRRHGYTR